MNNAYKPIFGIFIVFFAIVLLTSIPTISSGSEVINTFLVYEDAASATSKTVTQGDLFNVVMVAYGHGEALQYEKLELVGSATIFQEYVSGDKIDTYTWLYTNTYTINTGILIPGTYTLRFTAKTATTGSVEYSDLQLTILPKVVPPVCGNGIKEGTEQCDYGTSNGQTCNPLYGSSCTYCSTSCKLVTLNGPYCGDGTCSTVNGETCSTCSTDCGTCPDNIKPVVDITNPIATTYTSHRTSLTFSVYDDNLQSCTYKLNGNAVVPIQVVSNGFNVIVGITSVLGSNTWSVTCKDYSGNTGSDSVTFTVIIPPVCGNSIKEGTEQCDYGTNNGKVCNPLYGSSCTYCSNSCTLVTLNGPYCGDGTCSTVNGETCSTCSTDCGTCPAVCGNSIKEGTEQCDYGTLNGQTCNPLYGSSCTYCSSICKLITLTGPYCGDGIKQTNEACDDGNKVSGDGCSSTCQIEETKECILQLTKYVDKTNVQPGNTVTFTLKYKNIGNGDCTGGGVKIQDILNSNLDYLGSYTKTISGDSDLQSLSFGYYTIPGFDEISNTLTWNAHLVSPGEEGIIKFSVKVLEPEQCGDFQVGNYFNVWSNEKGWQTSNTIKLYVDNDCYLPVCGNGIIDSGEQCDDGNTINNDGCSNTCKLETCGDGIKQTNEQCDYGTLNGQTCNPLYGNSCTYCSSACKFITLTGPYCGDGIKQTNEACDDGNKINGDGCSATCTVEETKECVLQIIKLASDTTVQPGDTVTFTLKYKNIGNGDCTGGGVKIQDVLNSNLEYAGTYTKLITGDSDSQGLSFGYSGISGFDEATNTLTWNAHLVSPGEEGIIQFNVKVLEPEECGDFQITNQFKIWSNEKGLQNSNIITMFVDNGCYVPNCGNGIVDSGEQCDQGSSNGQVCTPSCGSSCTYCSGSCTLITVNSSCCGDSVCDESAGENCSTCPYDCGICKDDCNICKDSKPLDDSNYVPTTGKKTVVYDDSEDASSLPNEDKKSLFENNYSLITLILIIGVLILLILVIIIRLSRR